MKDINVTEKTVMSQILKLQIFKHDDDVIRNDHAHFMYNVCKYVDVKVTS